jgi:ubiquitin carboxyl-terminal hydrolase 5/13
LLDPAFVEAYTKQFKKQPPSGQLSALHDDFNFQLAKVVQALVSGEYAKEGSELNGVKPNQFRRVAGQGHPEFSTARQQDAEEYIR